jgi:hypothetical protein
MGAAAASALGLTVNAEGEAHEGQAPTKPARTEITDKSGKRLQRARRLRTKVAKKAAPADVTVTRRNRRRRFGFGAAFTDAACFTLSSRRRSREPPAHMFGQDQRTGVGRIPIGASDYSTAAYSYDDGAADPDLKRFSIDHDRDYIYRRCARRLARIRICFCSARGASWMDEVSNSMLGETSGRASHIRATFRNSWRPTPRPA